MSKEGTWRSNTAGRKMKVATATIPIVFESGGDPVQAGLVASLNRPGDNVTGVSSMNAELPSKQLGLLHELLPQAMRFAVLVNPNYSLVSPQSQTCGWRPGPLGGKSKSCLWRIRKLRRD